MNTQTRIVTINPTNRPFNTSPRNSPIQTSGDMRDSKAILWEALQTERFKEIKFQPDYPIAYLTVDFFAHQYQLVVGVTKPGYSPKHWAYAKLDAQLRHLGYKVIRFTDEEIRRELPMALDSIIEVASQIAKKRNRF